MLVDLPTACKAPNALELQSPKHMAPIQLPSLESATWPKPPAPVARVSDPLLLSCCACFRPRCPHLCRTVRAASRPCSAGPVGGRKEAGAHISAAATAAGGELQVCASTKNRAPSLTTAPNGPQTWHCVALQYNMRREPVVADQRRASFWPGAQRARPHMLVIVAGVAGVRQLPALHTWRDAPALQLLG